MQRSVTHRGAVAVADVSRDFSLKLLGLGLGLFLFLCLMSHAVLAGTTAARSSDTGWRDIARLGAWGTIERVFLDGVEAYRNGDYTQAINLWRGPAEQGHALAQFNLGVAYATGQGIDMNYASAVRWWLAAGYQGHTTAQYNLGLLYARGHGVEKNIATARMWWYMAAMGNDPAAQYYLGVLAATGHGESQNFTEAAWWWTRSAAQGYEQAVKGLEILEHHGDVEISKQ